MSILIVDPSQEERAKLQSQLESAGYEGVVSAESVPEALSYHDAGGFGRLLSSIDLVLMDFCLPKVQRSDFRAGPRPPKPAGRSVLLGLVDRGDSASIARAAEAGALDVICRPVVEAEMLMRVRCALSLQAERDARVKTKTALEIELAEKDCEMEQVVSYTTEILSLASHELKSPLANLMGFVDMILLDWDRHGPPSGKQKRPMDAVQRNGFRMDALVDDIMAMAKIESGILELMLTDLQGVAGYIQCQLDEKNMTLELVTPEIETLVHANELRLSQIMVNLLGNACKYSPPGSSISVVVQEAERFAQVVSGTGLGLYVTNQLMEAHGGKIWVKRAREAPSA